VHHSPHIDNARMELDPSTRVVHSGEGREQGSPSSPAIHTASNYWSLTDPGEGGYAYGRHGNPTWEELELALGELEGARALVFASGLAASFALLMATTADRVRVLLPGDGYFGVRKLAQMLAARGVEPVAIDMGDLAAVERELARKPAVLWGETPTNPFLRVLDLDALAKLAQRTGATFVVDNTTATSALQRPLDHGAVACVYSLTKSASGHSDVVLGAVTARDEELLKRVRLWRDNAGAIAGPFEAWLTLRGLRTLPLRIERQSSSALAIARHLAQHPRVRRVHYPSLDPATRAVAERQMHGGFGPLLSFELDGTAREADQVVQAARLLRCATSFGGVESSWERRARWPGEGAPESLIRVSIGLESPTDLIADLDAALAAR
jgi:cystathionine gamma-synthase